MVLGAAVVPLAIGCGSGVVDRIPTVTTVSATTVSVAPHGFDLVGPCIYDLLLQKPGVPQNGVLVIFERGDSSVVFADTTLRGMANQLDYAMLWAHQCNSRSHGDLQADAAQGQSVALFAALDQFAVNTSRPELSSSGVVLFGFSAAGTLAVTMASDVPNRVLGAIAYAPGDAYIDLSAYRYAPGLLNVPILVLTNAQDEIVGNRRSLLFFEHGRMANASWAFGVQNNTGHCCTNSSISAVLPWFSAVASAHSSIHADPQNSYGAPAFASFVCTPNGYIDSYGQTDCAITAANVGSESPVGGSTIDGWLPNRATGLAWLNWVTNTDTNSSQH